MTLQIVIVIFWSLLILAACWTDFRKFQIPNIIPGSLILLYGCSQLLVERPDFPWSNIVHFSIALAVSMLFFGLRWIGGGDAKLYAAIALWIPLSKAIFFMIATVTAGLVLAAGYLFTRKLRIRLAKKNPEGGRQETRIAYGLAIAAGGFLTLYFGGLELFFPAQNSLFDPIQVPAAGN